MACAVAISYLTLEQINKIQEILCFTSISTNKNNHDKIYDPISFFVVDNDVIHLPYWFAGSLLKIFPNSYYEYPRTELEFVGALFDKQIIVENEACSQLQQYGSTTLKINPKFGKHIIISKLISRIQLVTIILVRQNTQIDVWRQSLEKYTNAQIWIVGETEPDIFDTIICTRSKCQNIPDIYRLAIGFVVVSEVNMFYTRSNIPCLLSFHPRYVLVESSYQKHNDIQEHMMSAMCGNHSIVR